MKRKTFLELGRRQVFGKPARKHVGPVPPAPNPAEVPDFDLGTWRIRPSTARMTRADRIVALDDIALKVLLVLAEVGEAGVNRDVLAARIFGQGENAPRLKPPMSFLRRMFSEDGAVRIENAPGDAFVLRVGEPVAGRTLRGGSPEAVLQEVPTGVYAWTERRRRRWGAALAAVLVVLVLGSSLLYIADSRARLGLGTVVATAPLAAEPGPERSPSFSPDGRQVVYSWRAADSPGERLYVRGTAGGAPRRITNANGVDLFPTWSPGGALIAFQRIDGPQCDVYLVAPDGTGERRLAECSVDAPGPLAWRPDGMAVLYAFRTAPILPTQLVAVDVAEGRMVGVTNPTIGMPGDTLPALSQDGTRLIFVRSRALGVADLSLIDMGAGEVNRVLRDSFEIGGAAWEPGGRSVVFASGRGGRSELWRTFFDGTPPRLLLGSLQGDLRSPVFSNDGRQMAYERWRQQTRLLRVPMSDDLDVAPEPFLERGALDRGVQLSPDGSRYAFVSDQGGREQIWLLEVGAGEPRPLTRTDLVSLQSPRWSPDGRSLVVAGVREGNSDLWLVDATSGAMRQLTRDENAQVPSFSRDGNWLYWSSNRTGRWEIWRRAWPDGPAEQVTTEGGYAAQESRDGNLLYFVRPDRNGLWSRWPEPGGDDTLVTPDLAVADWNNWAVTEDAIWYVTRPDRENPQLARYGVLEQASARIRPLPGLLPRSGLGLAADGRSLLIAQVARTEIDLEVATLE